ncbi:MAG: flagellar basal body L-ring protein FlgH [Planctomycetota bacterium]
MCISQPHAVVGTVITIAILLLNDNPVATAQQTSLLHAGPRAGAQPGGPPAAVRAQAMSPRPGQQTLVSDPSMDLQAVSWTFEPAPPLRAFKMHDIITIRVDEIARVTAEGESEKRRLSLFQATLDEWIKITKDGLVPDPQEQGDPSISAQSTNNAIAEATVESRESMSFNIAAEIVDIRPNGSLVLEARKSFRINDNLWETSLTGICRADDVAPDNVVLSRDLLDLEISKQDRGALRDGYKRGWFQRLLDRFKPF